MVNKKIPRGQTPERKAYMKKYNADHPRRNRSEYKKAYDKENKEKIEKYRIENKVKIKNQRREHYIKNKDRLLKKQKKIYAKNTNSIIAYQKAYNKKNKDKIRERERAYSVNNKDIISHCQRLRRARKFNNGGSHTLQQRLEKFEILGNVCFYCGEDKSLTIDHNIPLSRGGTDNIDNILPACQSCNSRKRALTADEFLFRMNEVI